MAKLKKQHMTIHWKAIVQDDSSIPATEATLKEKATLVGRIGLMMLSAPQTLDCLPSLTLALKGRILTHNPFPIQQLGSIHIS